MSRRWAAVLMLVAACTTDPSDRPREAATSAPATAAISVVSPRPGGPGLGDRIYPFLGNGGYDAVHYDLALTVDPIAKTLSGTLTMEAVAGADLTEFNLDLTGLSVESVRVDGEVTAFTHHERELTIDPGGTLVNGTTFRVTVEYAGSPLVPQPSSGFPSGWQWAGDEGPAFVLSEPDGAATWFPSNDHPADKATLDLTVTVPAGVDVVSGGLRTDGPAADGSVTSRFEFTEPIAPYLVPLAIGQFDHGERGGVLVHWPAGSDEVLPLALFDRQGEMMGFLADRFGPYPFSTIGAVIVQSPLRAALETQTLPTYTTASLSFGEAVVIHELAHQWFGNSVSLDQWDDIWLNEGIATYVQWLWLAETAGIDTFDAQVTDSYERMSGRALMENEGLEPDQALRRIATVFPPPDRPRPTDLFNASVYQRGALTFVALSDQYGEESVISLLRTWADRFRGASAGTDDFLALVEELMGAGAVRLVEEWIGDPVIPSLDDRGLRPPG